MVKKTTAEQAAKWCQQSTSTLYEWKQRYAKHGYAGLIPGSRRPKRVRQSSLTEETVQAFIKLRTSPEGRGLGGRKLAVMLQREGHQISLSQGDRLVSRLLADRKIVPARHWGTKRVKRKQGVHVKPPKPQQPGDLVQIDTLHVPICPGQTAYQFSAVDCVTRFNAIASTTGFAVNIMPTTNENTGVGRVEINRADGGSPADMDIDDDGSATVEFLLRLQMDDGNLDDETITLTINCVARSRLEQGETGCTNAGAGNILVAGSAVGGNGASIIGDDDVPFERLPEQDFTIPAAGHDFPRGLWPNGTTMWVADTIDDRIYAYRMPPTE